MKALVVYDGSATVQDVPTPKARPHEVLVRVHAVALDDDGARARGGSRNHGSSPPSPPPMKLPPVVDFAGVVVAASAELAEGDDDDDDDDGDSDAVRTKVGARVAGLLPLAASVEASTAVVVVVAEYISIRPDRVFRVPDAVSLEHAATMPSASLTAARALFLHGGLPCPFWQPSSANALLLPQHPHNYRTRPFNIVVNGAATPLGWFVAQLANMANRHARLPIHLLGTTTGTTTHETNGPLLHTALAASPCYYDILFDAPPPSCPDDDDGFDDGWEWDWSRAMVRVMGARGADLGVDCFGGGAGTRRVCEALRGGARCVVLAGGGGGKGSGCGLVGGVDVCALLGVEVVYSTDEVEGDKVSASHPPSNTTTKTTHTKPNHTKQSFTAAYFKYLSEAGRRGEMPIEGTNARLVAGGLDGIIFNGADDDGHGNGAGGCAMLDDEFRGGGHRHARFNGKKRGVGFNKTVGDIGRSGGGGGLRPLLMPERVVYRIRR